jgi:hypothetical protein
MLFLPPGKAKTCFELCRAEETTIEGKKRLLEMNN